MEEPPLVPPAHETSDRPRFRALEWLALAAALVLAHLFWWRLVRYPSAFDAQNYLDIAADIGKNGLFTKYLHSDLRTYGYPLLLCGLARLAGALGAPLGFVVFEFQLALYLLAAFFVRRRLARSRPALAPWAFASLVLNPFALAYTPETLTESVSLSLILLGAGCWLALSDARGAAWQPVLAGSLVLGAAVEVRPANLFALCAWMVAVVASIAARRAPARAWFGAALAFAAGCALPMLPQYVLNVRNYERHTPLVAAPLAHDQQVWGVTNLKYATVLTGDPEERSQSSSRPRVFYSNPFYAGTEVDEQRPLAWYLDNPRAGAATLGLHAFGMLDQDLLFTYSRDLDPWYRLPLGVLNHALIALALLGGAWLAVRAWRERALVPAVLALAAFASAHLGLHATTLVEMRFGLPLLLLAGPMAAGALRGLVTSPTWRPRVLASALVVLWVAGSLALSHWMRQQAPSIRAWEQGPEAFAERRPGSAKPLKAVPARPGVQRDQRERKQGPGRKKPDGE